MRTLTPKQKAIYDFISEYIEKKQYAPSFREICSHFELNSLGAVHKYIATLEKKGYLQKDKYCSRSIALCQEKPEIVSTPEMLDVPLVGLLTPGRPIETFPQTEQLSIPKNLAPDKEQTYYALRIWGNSLQSVFMSDGDILLISVRSYAAPGEVIVATMEDGASFVRTYFPEGKYVRLECQSDNGVPPLFLEPDEFQILGVAASLIRIYD